MHIKKTKTLGTTPKRKRTKTTVDHIDKDTKQVAFEYAKENGFLKKRPKSNKNDRMHLCVYLDSKSGLDEIKPFLVALLRQKHGVLSHFLRSAIVKASKEALDSASV